MYAWYILYSQVYLCPSFLFIPTIRSSDLTERIEKRSSESQSRSSVYKGRGDSLGGERPAPREGAYRGDNQRGGPRPNQDRGSYQTRDGSRQDQDSGRKLEFKLK